MNRKEAREEVFKLLFESEMRGISPLEVLPNFMKRLAEEKAESNEVISENAVDFISNTATKMSEKSEEILESLRGNMVNWSIERVGNVEKALLKFGTYELLFEETGHEIVVNEIVELAKKYGDDKSHEFINGVLAKLINK